MDKKQAGSIIKGAFGSVFDRDKFIGFVGNLLNLNSTDYLHRNIGIYDTYKQHVQSLEVVAKFSDGKNEIDVLIVTLVKDTSLDKARTMQRNFVARYLSEKQGDAAIVAFTSPGAEDWRFSLIKMESSFKKTDTGIKVEEEFTPAKRWSFLVGKNENSHTAQSQLVGILANDEVAPTLDELEQAFSIETVTNEFFTKYTDLFLRMKEALDVLLENDPQLKSDFKDKEIDTADFAKKTMGQMAFLYFLQKKGWFGVAPDKEWGTGVKNFLREVFERREKYGENFFDNVLEPLFYEALAQNRSSDNDIYSKLNNCRMPFLNGGLFEPMNGYSWETTHIRLPDELFSNDTLTKEGDTGDGILDVFDRYNFTVNESEPLEQEVAVDPEMLGKVFENLLEIKDRKSKGAFYTPREIVHYMCQESLINYLETETNKLIPKIDIELFIQQGSQIIQNDKSIIEQGGDKGDLLLPKSISERAEELDDLLANIKVCDPAVGSGAFPLGMLNEIVTARTILGIHLRNNPSAYNLKLHAISNSIYGVDIDPGAVEIAKLRFWLSLVVEEDNPTPLPNLEHKIMQGNSLVSQYEGIELFDDDFLNSAESINDEKNEIQEKLDGIQREYFSLHSTGEFTTTRKVDIKKEIKRLQRSLKSLNNKHDHRAETGSLFDAPHAKKIAQQKSKLLQSKIAQFVTVDSKTNKENLKLEIDDLKWGLIEATLEERGETDKLDKIKEQRRERVKPFFIWKLEFGEVFKNNGGFDIVIGNPPYIKEYTEKDAFDGVRQSPYYQGKMDLWYLFACNGIDILKDNSVLSFIATNNWVTNFGASKMRDKIISDTRILQLIDFNNYKIFDSAGIQTMVMMFKKDSISDDYKFDYRRLNEDAIDFSNVLDVLERRNNNENEILSPRVHRGEYINKPLIFNNPIIGNILKNIEKLDNIKLTNKEVANGIHAHHDSVTKKMLPTLENKFNIGDGIFALNSLELENLHLTTKEKVLIKPYYTSKELRSYFGKKINQFWIIYTTSDFKNLEKINHFPNIKHHLDQFVKVITSSNKPYGLHRARNESFFKGEKIVSLRKCSNRPVFTYTDFDCYVSATFYVIKTERINQTLLTGFLNSSVCTFWLRYKGKMQGNNYQIDKEPLINIPIPILPGQLKESIIELVNQILNSKKSSSNEGTLALEQKIDKLFYKFYGLTNDDINVIEKSI